MEIKFKTKKEVEIFYELNDYIKKKLNSSVYVRDVLNKDHENLLNSIDRLERIKKLLDKAESNDTDF